MPIELNYRTFGHGMPRLVIIHGFLGSLRNWLPIVKQLSVDREVVAVDLRNHGGSPHLSSMGYIDMAGDIVELIDKLGGDSVDLLGHSLGGKVAMTTALMHANRCRRLIVVDIAPVTYPRGLRPAITAMESLDLDAIRSREQADAILASTIPDPRMRAFLLTNLHRQHDRYCWRVNLTAAANCAAELAAFPDWASGVCFEHDTLFVGGEHSDFIRDEHWECIKRRFPRAQLTVIANAGHWVHADRPGDFCHAVSAFLAPGATP